MSLAEALLPEFDQETASTRRILERVPYDRREWQPHAKSMTLGRLASHLAEIPSWVGPTFSLDELDLAPAGGPPFVPTVLGSTAEVLQVFDRNVAEARAVLARTPDAEFARPWTLKMTGREVFTLPKGAVLRAMVMSHMIHHRAQLGVYLRLNDVPLPSLYGPTADEPPV